MQFLTHIVELKRGVSWIWQLCFEPRTDYSLLFASAVNFNETTPTTATILLFVTWEQFFILQDRLGNDTWFAPVPSSISLASVLRFPRVSPVSFYFRSSRRPPTSLAKSFELNLLSTYVNFQKSLKFISDLAFLTDLDATTQLIEEERKPPQRKGDLVSWTEFYKLQVIPLLYYPAHIYHIIKYRSCTIQFTFQKTDLTLIIRTMLSCLCHVIFPKVI